MPLEEELDDELEELDELDELLDEDKSPLLEQVIVRSFGVQPVCLQHCIVFPLQLTVPFEQLGDFPSGQSKLPFEQ